MSGINHTGAWRRCRKIGDESAPRSAGCSRMNSAPAALAERSSIAVRRTSSLAWASSLAC
eukprot:3034791-Pleurochrysis_carterae.AAC.1